jgi:hypothetical protein
LLLAFELFIVVVGVDIARVQTALAKFAEGLGQDADADLSRRQRAAQYLEKIFQIAFWLSPLTIGGQDGGSYARYVKSLATPFPARSNAVGTTTQATGDAVSDQELVAVVEPSSTVPLPQTTAVTERPASNLGSRGLVTITLEPEEVDFLASDNIGRLAGNTPRAVKRLVNCYRLVRTRLGETGGLIMAVGGAPPLYPLIALMVAVETGQSVEVADSFYHALSASNAHESLNQIALVVSTPDNPSSSTNLIAKALSTCPALGDALDEVIKIRHGVLSVGELQPIAAIARRFSFNQPR